MSILSVQQISKNYGAVRALKSVSFDVPKGSVFGILGPNGSGKTTLLGIVMDVLKASSGSYSWMGLPGSSTQRKSIGTLLETPNFYSYLSGADNLAIAAAIKGRGQDEIDQVLETVNLLQRKDSKFNSYSLGMKQRLAIASTLLGNPDILVFDEPTNGLDPAGIAEIRNLIRKLSDQGKTIIMASHILDEVEKVCTHVAIIQFGELKAVGTVGEILAGGTKTEQIVMLSTEDLAALEACLGRMPGVLSITRKGPDLELLVSDSVSSSAINKFCFENNIVLDSLLLKKKTLEASFLEITGKKSDR